MAKKLKTGIAKRKKEDKLMIFKCYPYRVSGLLHNVTGPGSLKIWYNDIMRLKRTLSNQLGASEHKDYYIYYDTVYFKTEEHAAWMILRG